MDGLAGRSGRRLKVAAKGVAVDLMAWAAGSSGSRWRKWRRQRCWEGSDGSGVGKVATPRSRWLTAWREPTEVAGGNLCHAVGGGGIDDDGEGAATTAKARWDKMGLKISERINGGAVGQVQWNVKVGREHHGVMLATTCTWEGMGMMVQAIIHLIFEQ